MKGDIHYMAKTNLSQAKRRTFYETPDDTETIRKIKALRPHYTRNFMLREGLNMLLRSLELSDTPQYSTE